MFAFNSRRYLSDGGLFGLRSPSSISRSFFSVHSRSPFSPTAAPSSSNLRARILRHVGYARPARRIQQSPLMYDYRPTDERSLSLVPGIEKAIGAAGGT